MRYLALLSLFLVSIVGCSRVHTQDKREHELSQPTRSASDIPRKGDNMQIIYRDDERMVAVDLERQTKESNSVTSFIVLIVFPAPRGPGVMGISGRLAFDCITQRMRFESEFALGKDGEVIKSILTDEDAKWDSIPEGSIAEDAFPLVCGHKLMPQVGT